MAGEKKQRGRFISFLSKLWAWVMRWLIKLPVRLFLLIFNYLRRFFGPTFTSEGPELFEIKLVEQEHRTFRVWGNFLTYVIGSEKENPEWRNAARQAVIAWFFSSSSRTIMISLPIGAGAFLAWHANSILSQQNQLIGICAKFASRSVGGWRNRDRRGCFGGFDSLG